MLPNLLVRKDITHLISEESNEYGSIAHHPQHYDQAVQGYQAVVGQGL